MKRTVGVSIGMFVVAMIAVAPLMAGVNHWTRRGPQGGYVTAFISAAAEPQVLYAAVYGEGIFKTTDGGQTWRPMNDGLSDTSITGAVRNNASGSVYAASLGGVIFRSRDGGEHWSAVAKAPSYIVSLVVDSSAGVVYAATNDRLFSSQDDGNVWHDVPFGFPAAAMVTMNGLLYAVSNSAFYASKDGGTTWVPQPLPLANGRVLAVDQEQATLFIASDRLLAESTDAGATWKLLPPVVASSAGVSAFFVNRILASAGVVVVGTTGGVFRYDAGGVWTPLGDALRTTNVPVLASIAEGLSRLIAFATAGGGRVYSMTSAAPDWQAVDLRLQSAYTADLALAGTVVYASGDRLSRLAADAESWETVGDDSIANLGQIAASDSGKIISASRDGIIKSDDSGATWTRVTPGLTSSALAIAPSDVSTMYAGLSNAMSKSTDGGNTWKSIQNNMPENYYFSYYGFQASAVTVDPKDANTVFVSSDNVFKTTDGGAHWIQVVPNGMSAIAIDRFDSALIYGSSYSGIFRSSDGGLTWTLLGNIGTVTTLVTDPTRPRVVYAGIGAGVVYRSVDAGAHWATLNLGLAGGWINKIAIGASGDRLYAATAVGVFEYQADAAYLSGAKTVSVSLRTFYDNYVSADACGDSSVSGNATDAGRCETFTLYDVNGGDLQNGDRVYLQAANGDFVSAENGGSKGCSGCESPVNANRVIAAKWETFTIHKMQGIDPIIRDGDSISLQSFEGDYVSAENGGSNSCHCDSPLHANRPVPLAWETFVINMR